MADLQHVYADQLLNKWTLVSFQQTLVTKVVAQICQRPFYLFLHHSAPLCSSSQQVSGGEEIDSGVTHVLMFETCGNVFSACVRSQIERVTHSRVRYRLTDVLAREDKGKTERRDKGVEEAELFTQCRTTWSGPPSPPPDKHQTLLGSAGPLSSGSGPHGSSCLYLQPPHFTYRVWTVKSRRRFSPTSSANKAARDDSSEE